MSKKSLAAAAALLVVAPSAPALSVDECITQCVNFEGEGAVKRGIYQQMFADSLAVAFNTISAKTGESVPWHSKKSPNKALVKAKMDLFTAKMEALGTLTTGTIGVYRQRVKEKGGYVTKGDAAKGSAGKVKSADSIDARNIADLKTLLNRIENSEPDSCPLSSKAVFLLVLAADLMGIDVSGLAIADDVDLSLELHLPAEA